MRRPSRARPAGAALRAAVPALLAALLLPACSNDPWPAGAAAQNTLYVSFDERSPRHLDPTSSFGVNESPYTYSIHEPLYQYHYLERPYRLIPRAAAQVVQPQYLDAMGRPLAADAPAERIAQSVYDIPIRPGMQWAPHPAFATDAAGRPLLHQLTREQVRGKFSPYDFGATGTREVTAEDFVYAFKRHASPRLETPAQSMFAEAIVGLKDYAALLRAQDALLTDGLPASSLDKPFLDLRRWPLPGVQALDRHTLRLRIHGKAPQWNYWLALTFAAPVPWEADAFYAQPGMRGQGLWASRWPVGSGPYYLAEYDTDRRHVMRRNPLFRGETYPCEGMPGDAEAGLLHDCGKAMPFIDTVVAVMVKERVPRKQLFTQGHLDLPEVERSDWGVEFRTDMERSEAVRQRYTERGLRFPQAVDGASWYLGFNWLDPVVGRGDTPAQQERNRLLRQALSIAIDWEEGYGRIFSHVGGAAAHGPVPPGNFGSREGQPGWHNPVTHRVVDRRVERRPLAEAQALMAQAGYPEGRDARSGQPLVLNYDYGKVATPEKKAEFDWMVRQFAKLGVQLEVRATDYNQFRDKLRRGRHQVYWWGWTPDYPDAENYLFLLTGAQSMALRDGNNAANYQNDEVDRLYAELRTLDDGPRKQVVIDRMVVLLQQDAPWAWGYFPYASLAFQPWVHNGKPSIVIPDRIKYLRLDPALRTERVAQWNRPVGWPVGLMGAGVLALAAAAWRSWRRRESATGRPPGSMRRP